MIDLPTTMEAVRRAASADSGKPVLSGSQRRIGFIGIRSIVIEGLFALYGADLRNRMSLKIFVDTAPDVRFIRRMQRDIAARREWPGGRCDYDQGGERDRAAEAGLIRRIIH